MIEVGHRGHTVGIEILYAHAMDGEVTVVLVVENTRERR